MANETGILINRADIVGKVNEVLARNTADPAAELRKVGEIFIEISNTLEGLNAPQAKAVLHAVANLHAIEL